MSTGYTDEYRAQLRKRWDDEAKREIERTAREKAAERLARLVLEAKMDDFDLAGFKFRVVGTDHWPQMVAEARRVLGE